MACFRGSYCRTQLDSRIKRTCIASGGDIIEHGRVRIKCWIDVAHGLFPSIDTLLVDQSNDTRNRWTRSRSTVHQLYLAVESNRIIGSVCRYVRIASCCLRVVILGSSVAGLVVGEVGLDR